ncbi:recombination factor protein RarA [Williamsoniiplasma somnilux]|uniref:Recombination factor protein RarA n=1 Tax=Williamsoniiplasma somnilux TaxID=215578 RepID=A0A2K8NY88_9MOLU|nr:replication-associated recombination protein A [Williamsoniiplasma somnilux]ATZ18795.1 recombination factor protein RarA [Williamsoniiplasma somnilux]
MNKKPLAFILRPISTRNIVGQSKINSSNGLIQKMIKNNFLTSLIFFGPPGTGKTSFAIALANDLNVKYEIFNASYDKKEKLDKIINLAKNENNFILIIDEIHRMNKDKQDLLLEHMEAGNLTIFSTTTENPFFVINPAVRSRSTIVKLESITNQEMFEYFDKLLSDKIINLKISNEALNYLIEIAGGDLRSAINNLELFINLYADEYIDLDLVLKVMPLAKTRSGGYGDDFHDLKSALQKSIRGSDINASLYYFSRLVQIGDFETLMRRMVIMAYEDIGLANPNIPIHVLKACESFRIIGMPEGIIPLGLAIVEMALSEKSNSAYLAVNKAMSDVEAGIILDVPNHLKDTHYKSAAKLGYGKNYKYPHDFKNDWVDQQYLPNEIKNVQYYKPKISSAYEKKVIELYERMKGKKIIW